MRNVRRERALIRCAAESQWLIFGLNRPLSKTSLAEGRNNEGNHSMKPTLILVGADKGGVGKTTISRCILDYLARKNIMSRAFDTENPRGTLHRFYPNIT